MTDDFWLKIGFRGLSIPGYLKYIFQRNIILKEYDFFNTLLFSGQLRNSIFKDSIILFQMQVYFRNHFSRYF